MFERLAEGILFDSKVIDALHKYLLVLLHFRNALFISFDHTVTSRIHQAINQLVDLFLELTCFSEKALSGCL
ncbi:hypothetical protein [Roseobacter sp. MH60115]|uniref:hypothetical protein n=1 Tax=Roseobacter sp. MH60115 TaxID=2785324 RepID=UPI001E490333|nr:hypothetical protein [Roseobacter sp. MH60115]